MVEGLDVESSLCSFRTFCARMGLQVTLLIEYGKTCKSALKKLKILVRFHRIFDYLTNREVD